MKSFQFLSLAFLTIGALAAPNKRAADISNPASDVLARNNDYNYSQGCLTDARAQQVATNFANLISNYSDALANASLTVDYTDYSDSVNELIDSGCANGSAALGTPTFTTRAAFELGQAGQPNIPFQQLNIWHTCRTVIIRWRTALTPEFVTGLIVFETVPSPAGSKYKDLIKTVYSEFNSGAWLVDLGVFKPTCS